MSKSGYNAFSRSSLVRDVVAMQDLNTINMWAKQSCPKYTGSKLERRRFRKLYRDTAMAYFETKQHQELVVEYKGHNHCRNTYPWPYCDPGFANWEEDDSKEGYSLISDQSGCVIKYATSYVAYKIFEETGVWPQKTSSERLDAKRWVQFLAEAGYTEIVKRPEEGHHYVGVKPDEGEWGLVVWYEQGHSTRLRRTRDKYDIAIIKMAEISTYINKSYVFTSVDLDDYVWVKIN